MKKVIPIVLVAIVIAVVSGVVVSRLGATQASDKKPSTVTQNSPTLTANSQPNKPEDVQILKGSARADEDSKTKPFIGIRMGNLPDSEADALGIDGGVVVKAVGDGSPAAGKLMVDDIITSIARDGDEIPITSAEGVFEVVMDSEPGDTLAFEVLRDGDTVLVEVEVGEHEVRAIVRHKGVVSPLGIGNLMRYLRGNFVSAEVVMETEDGLKTITAKTGTVTNVNVANGRFTLIPADGSDNVSYGISGDSWVVTSSQGTLEGLNEDERTLVVSVDGDVKLVAQREGFGRHNRMQFNMPGKLKGGFRLERLGELRERFQQFQDVPELRERLQRIVPRIRERLKEHDFDLEQFLDESEIAELLEGVSSF